MQTRTIMDLHSKNIGHKKIACVVDELTNKGYIITDIKEYYEKFKFNADGLKFEYSKDWKAPASDYVKIFEATYKLTKACNK